MVASQSSSMATSEPASLIVEAFSRLAPARANDAMLASPLRQATFGEVESLSIAVSGRLAAAGISPGALVGLSVPNGPAFFAGLLGLRRAGMVPLLLDPFAPEEDRQRAVSELRAASVLSCSAAWPSSADEFQLSADGPPPHQSALPPEIAIVKLTSGSTGAPRGVAMREDQLLADEDALADSMGFLGSDRLLCVLPLSHSYGFTTLALSSMVRGLPLILPSTPGPFAPLDAARLLGATVFPTVPAYLQALLKLSEPPAWPEQLRLVISAGAVLPSHTAVQFRQTYGRSVHVFYGSSECGGICYDRVGDAAERGTVGTPVAGVRLSLAPADGDDSDEGVVTVESRAVGVTYLPEVDSRLIGGRFLTRDKAAWRGDELALLSRLDDVINLRGRKVDPSEVEKVLAALDGVDEAVVIGVGSPDGRDDIVRAVVVSTTGQLDYERVAAWCRGRLADHKVPRSIIIVAALPRTTRGKIDRAALRALEFGRDSSNRRG